MATLMLVFGVAAFAVPAESLASRILLALAESLLVALVLAAIVDPYLKATSFRDAAGQISEDLFWRSVSPHCPVAYREKIKELARAPLFASWDYTNVEFSWASTERDVLAVKVTMETAYTNTSAESYTPNRHPWLLASTPDFESEYLQWICRYRDGSFDEVLEREDLVPYLENRTDGALVLNEAVLVRRFNPPPVIAPDAGFEMSHKGRMYRRSRGYLPLIHATPVAAGLVRCSGPALADLNVRAMLSGKPVEPLDREDGQVVFKRGRLTAPGEGFLVSWKLREEPEAASEAVIIMTIEGS